MADMAGDDMRGWGRPAALPKKLFIKSYGCQMNVHDSERMTDVLEPMGYRSTADPDEADLVILNTCHIREKAAEKVYSELGRLRLVKERRARAGDRMLIAVAGCVAQAQGREIVRRQPAVDMVFGPQTYHRLSDHVTRVLEHGARVIDTDFPVEDKFDYLPEERRTSSPAAFLTVQEGCDRFCTFCVVPYTRGAEFSRPVEDIVREARGLAAKGVREITLLGQNVNAYHGRAPDRGGGQWGLGRLLRRLSRLEGLDRLRYTTSHPKDMDDELIDAHRDVPALMPFVHLPVQSGSDRILSSMNRQHTADTYRRLADKIRDARPNIALSSDFIVGFPGETDEDFDRTLKLVRDVDFAQSFSFKYSPRPGTPAADLADQVDDEVKSERLARLQALLKSQQERFNARCVGTTQSVLLEKEGRRAGQLIGRSPYLQAVHVEAPEAVIGDMVSIKIDSAGPNSLGGERVGRDEEPASCRPLPLVS